jgi:hypothetical protein
MTDQNYVSRRSHLLKSFDRSVAHAKKVLDYRFGDGLAATLIGQSRSEYEAIIPQIPYIGDRSPFLLFLLPTSRYLAVYRVLLRQGLTVEEGGRLIYRMNESELATIPILFRRIIGFLSFSPWYLRRLRRRAKESQERKYQGGYVLTFIEGDGRTFDYGFDYTECAGCKFLNQQGASELAPFLCAVDKVASEILGWGLARTMTIADGFKKCDFRYKKGGSTDIVLPPSIERVLTA